MGKPNLDIFATRLKTRLPVWVSPMADPQAVEVDALSMSWKGVFASAFTPFVILGKVLEKALKGHDSFWLVHPQEQVVNPFEVTVPQLADFFNVKQLHPRTIKGYRSAISATVSAYGSRREFSDSPELSALLQNFMLERPSQDTPSVEPPFDFTGPSEACL